MDEQRLLSGLEQIFGKAGESDETVEEEQPAENVPGETVAEGMSGLIKEANRLFESAQEAQKNGDWALYGDLLNQLKSVLAKLQNTVE